jgi:hypothetical protein
MIQNIAHKNTHNVRKKNLDSNNKTFFLFLSDQESKTSSRQPSQSSELPKFTASDFKVDEDSRYESCGFCLTVVQPTISKIVSSASVNEVSGVSATRCDPSLVADGTNNINSENENKVLVISYIRL